MTRVINQVACACAGDERIGLGGRRGYFMVLQHEGLIIDFPVNNTKRRIKPLKPQIRFLQISSGENRETKSESFKW